MWLFFEQPVRRVTKRSAMKKHSSRATEVFERTNGRCHICRQALAWSNYGRVGRRGAWEVDHSTPRAKGGTDRLSNLLPACPSCNRSKQDGSTRSARRKNGLIRKPLSQKEAAAKRERNVLGGAGVGVVALPFVGPVGVLGAMLLGAAIGAELEVE